jgi:mannosylglycerate hydrolase
MATLHLVSHTHWDREWYLPFQLFRLKLVHMLDSLLELLAADPQYRYFMLDGQTIVLDDYLVIRPEREEEIRAHVQSGRLLIGPWHILPDEFLVSPEATVRNLLQGGRTAGRFGPRMNVGYIPDPFGHIGQMPQILRGFGITTAVVSRGLGDQPCELEWQAPDGSCVFLDYLRDGYDNVAFFPLIDPPDLEPFWAGIRQKRDSLLPHTATEQILLMYGTDHMEPQPLTTAGLSYCQGRLDGDIIVYSTLPAYLEAVQADLRRQGVEVPIVTGELRNSQRRHLLLGVLSARMWIKQRNHACETLLEKWAEPFSVAAQHPASLLRQAWHLLMECHPHDSICGCSVDQVHEEMRARFDQVEQIGEEITRQSLVAIAAGVDTRPPVNLPGWCRPVVVFNPLAGPRRDAVQVSLEVPPGAGRLAVVDQAGRALPAGVIAVQSQELDRRVLDRAGLLALLGGVQEGRSSGRAIVGLDVQRDGDTLRVEVVMAESLEPDTAAIAQALPELMAAVQDPSLQRIIVRACTQTTTLEFVAPDVPGWGYRTVWVQAAALSPHPPVPSLLSRPFDFAQGKIWERGEGRLENEYLALQTSPTDGTLTVTDKRTGAAFAGLNRFVDGGDCGDEYNYCPPAEDFLVEGTPQDLAIRVCEDGAGRHLEVACVLPVPAGLSADRRQRCPETVPLAIRTVATLWPGVPRVDITTEVDNRARDHRLRVHFPLAFAVTAADYDGPFQVVRRAVALPPYDETWVEQPRPEVPQRAFTDVSDGETGLMVANRGLPEVAVLQDFTSSPTGDGGGGAGGARGRSEIALTLLRCVGWLSRGDLPNRRGHAGPALPSPGAQEIGQHRFAYALIPHHGGWEEAFQEAYAFDVPLRAVAAAVHEGARPAAAALLRVEPAQFVLSAVKSAEDGRGVVVRGYNIAAEPIRVTLAPGQRFARAARVRLDETEEVELAPADDGSVTLEARGHEIVTVRFG